MSRRRSSFESTYLLAHEFGRQLVESLDLDPVYVALEVLPHSHELKGRWLLAYWMFYDAGVASYLAECVDFWAACQVAAENLLPSPLGDRWPRGAERRHFRGAKCVRAVQVLAERYPDPASAIEYLAGPELDPSPYATIRDRVLDWPMFGPWIAFKVADMLERCLHWEIDFERSDVLSISDSPREGALLHWRTSSSPVEASELVPSARIAWAFEDLAERLRDLKAPPTGDRALGVQELETIFCKWKSYRAGSYRLGKDSEELRHVLDRWSSCSQLASHLRRMAP